MRGIDRTGRVYSRLTVVSEASKPEGSKRTNRQWLCRCECGVMKVVDGADLSRGDVRSCGCFKVEKATKHGKKGSRVYGIWAGMKKRILNPKEPCYPRYGGAGLEIEEDWKSFEAFYADMGDPPTERHSLDRVENSLGYIRGNCRWATPEEQMNNTKKNRFYEFDGESLTVAQWARKVGIRPHTLFMRLAYGWEFERALTTPVRPKLKSKE